MPDDDNSTASALLDAIACIARQAQGELNERAAALGLQRVHLQALAYLARANRYSNTAVALTDFLGSSKGTVSQSLQLLLRKGLIERRADPLDRRVLRLALSARGTQALQALDFAGAWDAAVATLAPGSAAAALATLGTALATLQRERGHLSFGVCNSCRHFRVEGEAAFRCGLTGEALAQADTLLICREHRMAAPAAADRASATEPSAGQR